MFGQPRNPFGGYVFPETTPPIVPPMAAAVQQKPKFFGEGGTGRTIIGIIADALAGATGGTPMYAPLMAQKRQLQMQREEEQRKLNQPIRTEIGGDYVEINPVNGSSRVLYKGTAKASVPYRWETNDGSLAEIGPDGQPRIVYKDPTPKIDYIEATNPVTGAKSLIPRVMGGPSAPVATTKAEYDALPPGSPYIAPDGSHRVKGGPTASPSGGFR